MRGFKLNRFQKVNFDIYVKIYYTIFISATQLFQLNRCSLIFHFKETGVTVLLYSLKGTTEDEVISTETKPSDYHNIKIKMTKRDWVKKGNPGR